MQVAYLQCAPTAASKDVWSWHWPKVKGGGPRARSGAVALPIGDRFVLLLGGWDREEPAAGAASASGGGGGGGGGRGGGCSARGASARGGAGAASAPPAPSPLEAEDASRPRGDPFPEAWLLDTGAPDASGGGGGEWEWLRVDFGGEPPAPDAGPAARAGYAAGVRLALGRAGHTAVFVPDVSGLLRAAAGGAPQTLSASPAEASLAAPAQPGVVIFGGRLGGGALSNDVVVLPLPRALVEAASARSAAAAAAAAEFAELAAQAAAARAASPVFDGQDEEEEPEGARGGGGGGGVGGGGGPSSFAPAPAPASAPELAPAADDDDDGWGAVLAQPNPTQ